MHVTARAHAVSKIDISAIVRIVEKSMCTKFHVDISIFARVTAKKVFFDHFYAVARMPKSCASKFSKIAIYAFVGSGEAVMCVKLHSKSFILGRDMTAQS